MAMEGFKRFLAYNKTYITFLIPLALTPLIFVIGTPEAKCGYCVLVMALFWMTNCIPLNATGLLPIIMMPLLNILSTEVVIKQYLKDASMMFIGGLVVAITIQDIGLHKRIALRILLLVGAQPRWLMLGFMFVTWFLSMWISNTATTAMMMPMMEAVLNQLAKPVKDAVELEERRGSSVSMSLSSNVERLQSIAMEHHDDEVDHGAPDIPTAKMTRNQSVASVQSYMSTAALSKDELPPRHGEGMTAAENLATMDKTTAAMFKGMNLCVCYAANIGGTGTLTGTTPNLIMKSMIDEHYMARGGKSPINFTSWMVFAVPGALLSLFLAWISLQFVYLGWRTVFGCCNKTKADPKVTQIIRDEYEKLGPTSFSEIIVIIHFAIVVLLWLSREPEFVPGWGDLFRRNYVTGTTAAIACSVSLCLWPSRKPNIFKDIFGKNDNEYSMDGESESKGPVPAIMTWETLNKKMPWGLIFLVGGGYALAEASQVTGLSKWIGEQFLVFRPLPPWLLVTVICLLVCALTQVTNNTTTITLLVPVLLNMSESIGLHPLYLAFPATLSASFAFMLPVATPPNAITYEYGYVTILDMVKSGGLLGVLCVMTSVLAVNTWGMAFFNLNKLPWAMNATITTTTTLIPPNITQALF